MIQTLQMQRQPMGETNLVGGHHEYGQAECRVNVILRWMIGDEERWGANTMDEYAQQELKTVQGKDGVTESLFGDPSCYGARQ
jgi:hypothetical protein